MLETMKALVIKKNFQSYHRDRSPSKVVQTMFALGILKPPPGVSIKATL